jgi:hypothetical protein
MPKLRSLAFSLVVLAGSAGPASAQFMAGPLPANAYISFGGFDWAWAYPLPNDAGGFTLAGQSGFGWRLPTAAEFAFAPSATDFLIDGGNVLHEGSDPVSGAFFSATNEAYIGDGACATPWFSTVYLHCDWGDGLGQPYGPWAGMAAAPEWADQLVIRGEVGSTVPEPATMSLVAIGLAGLSASRRRGRKG